MPFLAASASSGSVGGGKWEVGSYGGRTPPSRERETWIFVSFVTRETTAVRAGRAMVIQLEGKSEHCTVCTLL